MYCCDSDGLTSTHVSTDGAECAPGTALVRKDGNLFTSGRRLLGCPPPPEGTEATRERQPQQGGRDWHPGGDTTVDPQTTVRNSTLSAAVKSTPWSDMGGFSWKDDRCAEYMNTGPGSGAASGDRPQLTDAQAADQEVADWLGGWTPGA